MRMILKNLWMNRKQNGFIFAEIAIISILSFFFIDHFTVLTYNVYGCRHDGEFERDHLVVAEVEEIGTDTSATLNTLRDQIEALPEVQHVYANTGFVGESMLYESRYAPEADTTHCVVAVEGWFLLHEHFFETQGLTPIEGSPSTQELSECSMDDAVITRSMALALFGTDQVVGRRIVELRSVDPRVISGKFCNHYTIAGVVKDYRLKPEDRNACSILTPREHGIMPKMLIRLRPEANAKAFVAKLQSASRPMHAGKYIIHKVITYNDYTSDKLPTSDLFIEGAIFGILLILFFLNVAIGTLGTYWLQILKRTEDFGIMRSFGAKRINVFGMIWSEVALLTFFACLLGQVIWLQMALQTGLSDGMCVTGTGMEKDWVNNFWLHYAIICLVQYIILLTIVTLGMIVPSLIATYKKPVDALHYE